MNADRCRAAILISGSGTNLQAFIDRGAANELDLDICVVISNRTDALGLNRAEKAGIVTDCIDHMAFEDRESFDRALAASLDRYRPDLVILAGFMRILSPWFVEHYDGRILNIHPALLPAYPGLDTHQRVLDAGERFHGSTVHFVTTELDAGPPVLQGRITIGAEDTALKLLQRVQAVEHQIYPEAANWFATGRLELRGRQAWLDGKRLMEPVVADFSQLQ